MTQKILQAPSGLGARSLGLKLIVILLLIVLMAVPIIFISVISFERSSRADEVTREVGQTYGGPQTLSGPVVVVPFQQTLAEGRLRQGDFVVSALSGEAVFDGIMVEEKARSLYRVPVYTADGTLSAQFAPLEDSLPADEGLEFDTSRARIVFAMQDVTGLQRDVTLRAGGQSLTFEPYRGVGYGRVPTRTVPDVYDSTGRVVAPSPTSVITEPLESRGLTLLSAPLPEALRERGGEAVVAVSLTGAPSFGVLPYARSTELRVAADWAHPGFEGRFPPGEREIADSGFAATWSVPFLRRGIPASGRATEMGELFGSNAAMQVNFVTPLDPYRTVNRALKYAVMFIGLVFLAYFLMETLLGVRVHPAQYLLIGLAQAVFYLLLLAFAEQIGFTPAFILSAVATVALTSLYAGAVFGRSLIWKSALVFGTVYGLLFVLMRIQDFALMVGALVCFVAIAATLYLTRNLDWYGGRAQE